MKPVIVLDNVDLTLGSGPARVHVRSPMGMAPVIVIISVNLPD